MEWGNCQVLGRGVKGVIRGKKKTADRNPFNTRLGQTLTIAST